MVENAIAFDKISKEKLSIVMREITDLDNPNSVVQMKAWLSEQGIETESLGKKDVAKVMDEVDGEVKDALQLRQQLAKLSVKKYQAMQNAICADGRARGMCQFYGANRSGRWAGRIIQLQNLPQNHMEDLEQARGLVKNGDYEALSMLYDSAPNVLSELIRTAFVARESNKFAVADFSAIEARVLSWLAGETWRTQVFVNNGVCISHVWCTGGKGRTECSFKTERKDCRTSIWLWRFSRSTKIYGAIEMGLAEEELQPLVDSWRAANSNIVKFWWRVDRAVKTAVKQKKQTDVNGIRFFCQSGMV